jgi:hypothetical protein
MTYVELPSDHNFSAFLAGLTPSKVLTDRTAMFAKSERARSRFLVQKTRLERQVELERMVRVLSSDGRGNQ